MLALCLKSCVCPRDQSSANHSGDHPVQLSCVSARVGKAVKREADHTSGNLSQTPKGCTELRLEYTDALRSNGKYKGWFGWSGMGVPEQVPGWLALSDPVGQP